MPKETNGEHLFLKYAAAITRDERVPADAMGEAFKIIARDMRHAADLFDAAAQAFEEILAERHKLN